MARIECTAQRLVLQAGGTTLILDKETGAACLHRKALFWDRPAAVPLADICKIAVTPAFERSCGFATCYTLLVSRSGNHLELPPAAKASAEEAARAIREFLGLSESA